MEHTYVPMNIPMKNNQKLSDIPVVQLEGPKPNRSCGTCTACCEGWLHADIEVEGHELTSMYPGRPCQYIDQGVGCTVYDKRPLNPCRRFICEWLGDKDFRIPDWMQPNQSGIIIAKKKWGDNGEHDYWAVTEMSKPMTGVVLNWLIIHVEKWRIDCEYMVHGGFNRLGSREFHEWMDSKTLEKVLMNGQRGQL